MPWHFGLCVLVLVCGFMLCVKKDDGTHKPRMGWFSYKSNQ